MALTLALALVLAAGVLVTITPGASAGEDVLVLRPQSPLKGKQVEGFDEDGVKVAGMMRPFGWDELASGQVSRDQERFDRLLRELGEPLHRIRQGLRVGDYRSILEPAEEVFPRYAARRSATAYMVCQGLMWARLAHQRREAALEPYLLGLEILRLDRSRASLPGSRRLHWDGTTGMSADLAPVWFDRAAAAAALPRVKQVLTTLGKPPLPGVFIYASTLALAAGDVAASEAYLAQVGDSPAHALTDLVQVVKAQQNIARGRSYLAVNALDAWLGAASEANKPLVRYTAGLARCAQEDPMVRKDGVIDLLAVAAIDGDEHPELSAAALDQARRVLLEQKDAAGAQKVGEELLGTFPETYHGVQLRRELSHPGPGSSSGSSTTVTAPPGG
jgi:hypothetical protein